MQAVKLLKSPINTKFFILLIICILSFLLGNYVYAISLPLLLQSGLSELFFICLYVLVDKGNLEYGLKYTICILIFMLQMLLPCYVSQFKLFYSHSVQLYSVCIGSLSLLVNYFTVTKLAGAGFTRLLSSRLASTCATILDIIFFSYLLDIGLKGAIMMACYRAIYILLFTKIIFKNR